MYDIITTDPEGYIILSYNNRRPSEKEICETSHANRKTTRPITPHMITEKFRENVVGYSECIKLLKNL